MRTMRKAVITGLGVVSPIGLTVEDFWSNLTGGVSGIAPITQFDASSLHVRIAGEVRGFDPKNYMEAKEARRMERFAQFAVAVSRMALEDAGLEVTPENADAIGLVMNTGGGGMNQVAVEERTYLERGPDRVTPFFVPLMAPNMAAAQPSIQLGIQGPVITSVAACAAGTMAMVEALRMLRAGDAEVVIAGGTESCMLPLAFAGLHNMHALSNRNDEPARASRPFDLERDGFVFGEGAGALVVETEEHALARGARILCELAGGAITGDAYHITAPQPQGEGAVRAMTRALQDSGMTANDVEYICAHGTATPMNDASETSAIKKTFGERAYKIPISSNKSMIGHLLGAAGAMSSLATVLTISRGLISPTINLETPDPTCDLDYVPNVARKQNVKAAIANGFGFGGQNAVAAFRAYV